MEKFNKYNKETSYGSIGHTALTLVCLLALVLSTTNALAQLSTNELPVSFTKRFALKEKIAEKMAVGLPSIDSIMKEDIRDSLNGMPPRFGYPLKVNWTTENSGTWEDLPDGGKLWRLTIHSPGAKSINLLYDHFWIPDSSKFFLYNQDKTKHYGAFTSQNNKGTREKPGKFTTALIYGEKITLEYYQPAGVTEKPVISIAYVVHGYRYVNINGEAGVLAFGNSLPCNININCWEGSQYQIEKRSVAVIVVDVGSRICTGSLINNTSSNMEPYFLTANHCLGGLDAVTNPDAGYWWFMWNYEAPTCPNPSVEPSYYSTSSATVVANYQPTDMALLRLTEDPNDLTCYSPSYVGWSRSTSGATSSVGIHHPRGDIKKISVSYSAAVPNPNTLNWTDGTTSPSNSHWTVQLSSGATEPGSSGSFLLNQDKLIVGQLHGGNGNCAPSQMFYGRFDWSWNNGGSAQRRLRDWLDPTNTGLSIVYTIERGISGPSIVCNSATYTLQNPPSGASITWAVTTSGVFNLSPSGNSVTLTKVSEGSTILEARVGTCVIASKEITTITTPEIYNTQYGTCNGTWQEWYLQASSNNGGSNWNWHTGTLPPGVQINIYNPSAPNTYASISGGAGAVLLDFIDNCGNTVNAGTTIYSPCPMATLFHATYMQDTKSIKIKLNGANDGNKPDTKKLQMGSYIEKIIVRTPNGQREPLEKTFTSGSYEAVIDVSELGPGRYLVEVKSGKIQEGQVVEIP